MSELGITIEGKHTYRDFGLKWMSTEIENPERIANYIQVPGSSTQINSTGKQVCYGRRKLSFSFDCVEDEMGWRDRHSQFSDFLHGKEGKVILDTDDSYYYYGLIAVESSKEDYVFCDFVITVDADPFKYDLTSSMEDWLWDPFDFETGVIRELMNLEISTANNAVEILGGHVSVAPIINVQRIDSPMSITVAGKTYPLKLGRNRFPQIRVGKEDVILIFSGKGLVSIDYRGRIL